MQKEDIPEEMVKERTEQKPEEETGDSGKEGEARNLEVMLLRVRSKMLLILLQS